MTLELYPQISGGVPLILTLHWAVMANSLTRRGSGQSAVD
jgi:hypothetical protein